MKKLFALMIGMTLLCGSLFPVAAAQLGETKLPHYSEIIPPPTWNLETEQETAQEPAADDAAQEPAATPQGLIGAIENSDTGAFQNAGAAATDTNLTLTCDGYTAELVSGGVNLYNSVTPDMFLYFHVTNQSDKILNLSIEDVVIDGVSLAATGIYEVHPGTDNGDDPDRVWIMPHSDSTEGSNAILNGKTMQGTLILKDDYTREILCVKEFTLDLGTVEWEINDYTYDTSDISDTSDTSDTINNTEINSPDYTPSPSYRTLQQGDTGEDVYNLQLQLIDLGYLYDTADGIFGPKTAAAVKDFNEANGLDGGQVADYTMQNLAFSGLANPYTEPWIPLEIGSNFYYDPIPSVNTFFFKVEVTNHSRSRTIKGYELSVYYTDVWGKWLDGGVTYTQTMTQPVYPGQTVYSANFNLGNYYSVDTVWVGVSKIVFDDGEIREADEDDIVYYSCQIPTRIY